MKVNVDLEHAEVVQQYIRAISGEKIVLDDGQKVWLLKGDVKIKPDQAILIYRYQIIM